MRPPYHEPCGAATAGGLYTLNCESVVAVLGGCGGGGDAGSGTAVAGVGSVLGDASSGALGAVDARVGGDDVAGFLLLGVDIG